MGKMWFIILWQFFLEWSAHHLCKDHMCLLNPGSQVSPPPHPNPIALVLEIRAHNLHL